DSLSSLEKARDVLPDALHRGLQTIAHPRLLLRRAATGLHGRAAVGPHDDALLRVGGHEHLEIAADLHARAGRLRAQTHEVAIDVEALLPARGRSVERDPGGLAQLAHERVA